MQEATTNVLKHAGPAGRAWVRLHWRAEALELSVLDDGRGAAAAVVDVDGQGGGQGDGHGHGHGLIGMRERADAIGARLEIVSVPREGTTVRCEVTAT